MSEFGRSIGRAYKLVEEAGLPFVASDSLARLVPASFQIDRSAYGLGVGPDRLKESTSARAEPPFRYRQTIPPNKTTTTTTNPIAKILSTIAAKFGERIINPKTHIIKAATARITAISLLSRLRAIIRSKHPTGPPPHRISLRAPPITRSQSNAGPGSTLFVWMWKCPSTPA